MRPRQWSKNGIIFAGLVFALRLFDPRSVLLTVAAFVIFCGVSGGVYILNDLLDLQRDQQHPTKRFRPLPSGRLPLAWARAGLVVVMGISLPVSFLLSFRFGLVTLAYFVLMVVYSLLLKHIVIIDIFAIAAGFVLRAMAGPLAIDVPISPWLYVCTLLLALFLGLAKRRHEMILLGDGAANHRKILEEYSPALVEEMMAVVTSSTVIAYSLYTFFADNLPSNHYMMLTIPFVLYAIFRYLYLVYQRNEGGSPEHLLFRDLPLLIDIFLWGLTAVAILYVFNHGV